MRWKVDFAGLLTMQRRQGSYHFSELHNAAKYRDQYSLYFSEDLQSGKKPALLLEMEQCRFKGTPWRLSSPCSAQSRTNLRVR